MLSQSMQWILWAIVMVVFLALTLTGHTTLLGMTITAVALVWYTVVPTARRNDNRGRR
ncbi:MAG: hypothetical protein ACLPND_06090 [Candidatus Korobacteraceae bacterium]|jgi:hypothetical protein